MTDGHDGMAEIRPLVSRGDLPPRDGRALGMEPSSTGTTSNTGPTSKLAAGDPIRVLVVDDHALFRRGLEMVLAQEPDIEVVGEASDGAEAVEKAAETLPDIVLMDVRMPKRSGIEACTAIKDVVPAQRSSC